MSSEYTLSNYVSLIRGTTYKGDLVNLPGPVLLGLASIQSDGGFRWGAFKTYGGECPAKITLKSGDLYVSLKDVTQSGDLLGSVARVPKQIKSGRLTQDTVKLELSGRAINPSYLYWMLRTPQYREYCRSRATGTTTLGLAREDFLAFPIADPKPEQDSLVELLEGIEERIELLAETNVTLEAIAQALFKSWFVDFDPVHANAGTQAPSLPPEIQALFPATFTDSPQGLIPEGWQICSVEDIAERVGMGPFGSNIKVSTFVESGIPVISGQHLKNYLVEDNSFNFVTEEHAQKLAKSCVHAGDVIFTHAGSIGQVSLLHRDSRYKKYVLSQRQFFLRCDPEKMAPEWMTYYFKSPSGQHQLLANTSQVGVPSIARPVSYLRSIQFVKPPIEIVGRFAEIVDALNSKTMGLRQQLNNLMQIRDTLLPRLISGQLRLPEAEQVVAAITD